MNLRHLPNIITCLRALLIVPSLMALWSQHFGLAFYLFLIAGVSDGLDGFLARQFNWGSRFGSIADPLSDKLLMISMLITMGLIKVLPLWLVVLIIVRDLWILSGAVAYHYWIGRYNITPNWTGKIYTFLLITLIAATLFTHGVIHLPDNFIFILTTLVLLTCVVSWVDYTWVWGKKAWRETTLKRAPL